MLSNRYSWQFTVSLRLKDCGEQKSCKFLGSKAILLYILQESKAFFSPKKLVDVSSFGIVYDNQSWSNKSGITYHIFIQLEVVKYLLLALTFDWLRVSQPSILHRWVGVCAVNTWMNIISKLAWYKIATSIEFMIWYFPCPPTKLTKIWSKLDVSMARNLCEGQYVYYNTTT